MTPVTQRPAPLAPVAPPVAPQAAARAVPESCGDLLACLQVALRAHDWTACTAEVTSELNRQMRCLRVSMGWMVSGQLRVVALSDGVVVDDGAALPELQQAMLEALHQQVTLTWPPHGKPGVHITLAHQALYKTQGLAAVLSVPMAHHGRPAGVLTFERSVVSDPLSPQPQVNAGDVAFTPAERVWLEQLAESLSPLFVIRHKLDRPWRERLRALFWVTLYRLRDPRERKLRLGVAAAALVLAAGLLVPVPMHVTAQARLEGAVQRVLSASQDGFLRAVHVRPGDVVKAGQLLAELADDDLRNARRAREAEIVQHENAFAEAFARGDRAAAAQAQAKLGETRAQLGLVDQQLQRLRLVAPFDGVVIAGDLRQQLGAPVKRGEVLLTLAPGLDWRVVMAVEEPDVPDLAPGQRAGLRLAAMPDQVIGLEIERVTPVATSTDAGVRYEVEAAPTGRGAGLAGLRPGLQGVVQVELASQPLLVRWCNRLWARWQLLRWTWF
ncbi:HlyD family efflux transporter periplasmic adaptor subunit [Aquabacterium lacunae]|uniref:HlyD family efflux transporter periplasmic adaptor subunit n=1 Tax=Aquabacterium lacunae TaxID=2528630 RepID=A0A4Q9H4X3_9BURK|nr:HlyD family efflux transporter periplasmic adaptor subunit [Aquabacterium lacunae]TBO32580.1 HlyD family efflux transporter periplasmic adaptor subunit [Aquabacterium lacunae]